MRRLPLVMFSPILCAVALGGCGSLGWFGSDSSPQQIAFYGDGSSQVIANTGEGSGDAGDKAPIDDTGPVTDPGAGSGWVNGYAYSSAAARQDGGSAIQLSPVPLQGAEGITQATVSCGETEAATNEKGAYVLGDVPGGSQTIEVTVSGAGGASYTIDVPNGDVVSGPPSTSATEGAINGYVYQAGAPSGLELTFLPLPDPTLMPAAGADVLLDTGERAMVGSTGFVEIAKVEPGTRTLNARLASGTSVVSAAVLVEVRQGMTTPLGLGTTEDPFEDVIGLSRTITSLDVTVAGTGGVTGRATDGGAIPLPDTRVVLSPVSSTRSLTRAALPSALTGTDGAFGFANVPPGAYALTVAVESGGQVSEQSDVAADAISEVGIDTGEGPLNVDNLIYAAGPSGSRQIKVISADGVRSARLTDSAGDNSYPTWAPDGSMAAFVSTRNGRSEVFVMDGRGGDQHPLAQAPLARDLSWSPQGDVIVYSAASTGGQFDVFSVDLAGKVTKLTSTPASELSPSLSPDGSQLAFASDQAGNRDVYVMDLSTRVPVRLTSDPSPDEGPEWDPGGTKIAFVSKRDGNGEVYTVTMTGDAIERITDTRLNEADPTWSPDGGKLAFVQEAFGQSEVHALTLGGTRIDKLTSESGTAVTPDWSPTTRD